MTNTTDGIVVNTPPNPMRDVSSILRLPPSFGTQREFPLYKQKSTVVVLSTQADDALLKEVLALNEASLPKANKVLFRCHRLLLFEMEWDASDVHQESAEHLMRGLQNFSRSLERRTGIAPLYFWNSSKRKLGPAPDVIFKKGWVKGRHHLVTVLAEVSYGVDLDLTHPRIKDFSDEYPTLRTAFIIRIDYPWKKFPIGHPKHDFYDFNNGKMIIFRYDYPHFDRASSAISFGDDPITNDDIVSYLEDKNIDANNITGFGVGDAPACDAPHIPLYKIRIDKDVLFMDYTNSELEDNEEGGDGNKEDGMLRVTMRDRLIEALGEDVDALNFNIDLFRLKRDTIEMGIGAMNETIEEIVGIRKPRID